MVKKITMGLRNILSHTLLNSLIQDWVKSLRLNNSTAAIRKLALASTQMQRL